MSKENLQVCLMDINSLVIQAESCGVCKDMTVEMCDTLNYGKRRRKRQLPVGESTKSCWANKRWIRWKKNNKTCNWPKNYLFKIQK